MLAVTLGVLIHGNVREWNSVSHNTLNSISKTRWLQLQSGECVCHGIKRYLRKSGLYTM